MKTKIYTMILTVFVIFISSQQVGINIANPSATLDVNGTLKIRDTPMVTALPGYQIMAVNQGNFQVAKVDPQVIIDAAANAANTNTTVYSAKKTGGITLLTLSLFSSWKQVTFASSDRVVGNAALYSETDYSYKVPSAGVYALGFYFRYGTGLQASLLTGIEGTPGIGIIKNTGGTFSILDSREFNGINLAIAINVSLSESSIHSLYRLEANDKLYFGILNSGLLNAGLLTSSNASFFIYKVSN